MPLLIQLILYLLRMLITPFLALVLVFEEWGWEPLSAALAKLSKLRVWAWIEQRIASLPRWAALLVLGVPMLALLPVKLLALYLLGHGHILLSVAILVGSKLAGTTVVARLFQLTQPTLMQFGWFARWYPRWKTWKDGVLHRVRQSLAWRAVRRLKAGTKRTVRHWRSGRRHLS